MSKCHDYIYNSFPGFEILLLAVPNRKNSVLC